MIEWFKDFLVLGQENNASEWYIPLDSVAFLRIDGKTVKTDLHIDNDIFVALIQDMLPKKQLEKLEKDEGTDFINENFLFYDENNTRFLGNL